MIAGVHWKILDVCASFLFIIGVILICLVFTKYGNEELDVDSKDDFCMGDLDEFDEEADIDDSELEIDEDVMMLFVRVR